MEYYTDLRKDLIRAGCSEAAAEEAVNYLLSLRIYEDTPLKHPETTAIMVSKIIAEKSCGVSLADIQKVVMPHFCE